jgi:hypothetical protein
MRRWSMSDQDESFSPPDDRSPAEQLRDAAVAEKNIADGIEAAIGTPASIEEEQMLEAAELLEVELAED